MVRTAPNAIVFPGTEGRPAESNAPEALPSLAKGEEFVSLMEPVAVLRAGEARIVR